MEIRLEKKILFVDDELSMRDYWETELSDAGYQVLLAADGSEALEIAEKETPDLAIIDVLLPGLDGITLCEKIRRLDNMGNVPVILISGIFKDYEFRSRIGPSLADAFFTKPLDREVLLSKIRALLETVRE